MDVYSEGIEAHWLNPHAVKVVTEAGVDITSQRSENIKDFADQKLDVVVTVCGHAHETCPVFPDDCRVVHVGFEDPPKMARELADAGASEEDQMNCYLKVRDETKQANLVDSLLRANWTKSQLLEKKACLDCVCIGQKRMKLPGLSNSRRIAHS